MLDNGTKKRIDSTNGLMSATQEDLFSVKGIGKAKMAQILATYHES